jgi:hypothetical protein
LRIYFGREDFGLGVPGLNQARLDLFKFLLQAFAQVILDAEQLTASCNRLRQVQYCFPRFFQLK